MTNEYELADDNRADLIFEKKDLLAPLLPGMAAPPHQMVPGTTDTDYYQGKVTDAVAVAARRGRGPQARHVDRAGGRRGGDGMTALLAAVETSGNTGEQAVFWMCAFFAVGGALGMLMSRQAVHSALFLATTMIALAILYVAQQAPFLGMMQIVVYTGAVMMLFLFVLMIVGVDASDSLVETLKGQRLAAIVFGIGFAALLILGIGQALLEPVIGLDVANAADGGNVQGIARLIFGRYVLAFEVTSALLITAALGAMVLAHRERVTPRKTQRAAVRGEGALRPPAEPPRPRCVRPPQRGRHPGAAARRHPDGPLRAGAAARRQRTGRGRPRGHAARDRAGRGRRGRTDDGRGGRVVNPSNYIYLSAILFSLGAVGVLMRRNAIVVFMCVELMLNACNLAFVTFSRVHGNLDGQVIAFFVMVVAAAEVVVGLAIIMTIFRTRRSASVDEANLLKY